MTADARIALLLRILDQAFDKRAWHGTTLRGALRGLTDEVAAWRPAPDRHSIWEYLLHAAYWKHIVRRHLTGDLKARFPRKPRNWPAPSASLKSDVGFLQEQHRLLRAAVESFPAARLERRVGKSGLTYAVLIHGVAAHDLYHTGQIQLLKRLEAGD